MIEHSS